MERAWLTVSQVVGEEHQQESIVWYNTVNIVYCERNVLCFLLRNAYYPHSCVELPCHQAKPAQSFGTKKEAWFTISFLMSVAVLL